MSKKTATLQATATGMTVERRFTRAGEDVYESVEWSRRDSRITNPDGSIVFEMKGAEVPASWSQVAADIMVSKYFRKAGVPLLDAKGNPTFDENGKMITGAERSARQVIKRLASTWRWWGAQHGYFASDDDAEAFEDELTYMLLHQMAAPNSPQWFNTGLHHSYGIAGTPQGFWYVDPATEQLVESPDSYSRPAPHACFPAGTLITTREGFKPIDKIEIGDEVLTHLGRYRRVTEVMQRQADEPLVRLLVWAAVGPTSATVILNEPGFEVRATANHPVLAFRAVAVEASADVAALAPEWIEAGKLEKGDYIAVARPTGRRIGVYDVSRVAVIEADPFEGTVYNLQVDDDESYVAEGIVVHNCFINGIDDDLVNPGGIMDLWVREARLFKMGAGSGANFSKIRAEGEPLSGGGKSSGLMSFLKVGDRAAGAIKSGGTTRRAAKMVIVDIDHPDIEAFVNWKAEEEKKVRALVAAGYPSDFNGEAYLTVSGQNSNNSVRLSNEFLRAVLDDTDWELTARTDGSVMKTVRARDLWRQIAQAAWECADPGVQFRTTIQEWHTSPAGGEIRATNPCFTGETRVATDKGLIQIRDLVHRAGEGESFEVYSHDATNAEAPAESVRLSAPTQLMVTGTNEIVKLAFSDGREIRCTPNHRFFTHNRGWVRADELTDDDRVRLLDREIDFGMASWAIPASTDPSSYQQRSSRRTAVSLPEKWSEDLAHYLGWLVGDGSMTHKVAATIYGTEEEQQSTMLLHQELLAAMNGGVVPKPTRMQNGTYQLRVTRGAIRKFLQALGVMQVKSADKRVPWSIFEAPKPIVAAFLRGLFDADGCVVWTGDKNRYAGLGSVSDALLRDVQQLLDTFGVSAKIYTTRAASSSSGFEYTAADGSHRSYESKAMHDLRITGAALARFSAKVGFELSIKQNILDQMLRETTRYRTRDWVSLKSRSDDGFETTYNLTEPVNHSYLAHGAYVSNCSEYVFIDNTACNLASLNLGTFYDDDSGVFDIESYRHAIRLWTIVLEISVTMAQFPSAEIAQGSYDYRTLGLGYANLGSVLMRMGVAYDSPEALAVSGALTAVLTGDAYATSAEMASHLGPFPKFAENRDAMLRVMRNHRAAAYDKDEYDGVSHTVVGISAANCPPDMLAAARDAWDTAVALGEEHGYRNAQSSVLAPTGTIGLLMDCDTTGVEPDFALVKFKKLAGGGYFKIANQSIAPALRRLDYSRTQIEQILDYVVGTMSLARAPHVNMATLIAKGFTADDIQKIEDVLPGVFELGFAFNQWTLGEATMQRLGFTPDQYNDPRFSMLKGLGFTDAEIAEANDYVCGRQTIEGAPHLRDEHLPVFDCANKNGRIGERFIHHTGHIKMMAAAQPFISGAISKCVTGDTLLATADGLVRIASLHEGEAPDSFREEVIEVASLDGTQKTDAFYYGGERQVRTVTLRSGHRVTGTPNHRLLTAQDGALVWRRLGEIEPGEHVATHYGADLWSAVPARFDDFEPSAPYGNQKPVDIPTEMTTELAFLLGAYASEGHTSRSNWTVTIANSDEGVLARVAAAWRSEFGVDARITRQPGKCPGVVVASKTIVEFLEHLGAGSRATDKRIPDAVLRSPRPTVLAFLQGLFLDGYVGVGNGTDRMAICLASNGLLDDLQAVLTNLGVLHNRITKPPVHAPTAGWAAAAHDKEYGKDFDEVLAHGPAAQMLSRLVPFAEADKRQRQLELLRRRYAQSTADIIPGLDPRELYELIPRRMRGQGRGDRVRFGFLLDPRTKHVSRRTLERVAMLPEVDLPEWLHTILADGLHVSPVVDVAEAGVREVYDVSVPTNHAFVGNGIVNHNTINMPNEVTIEDIEESYSMSWELGLKAMALYRDGSKASQPLSAKSDDGVSEEEEEGLEDALAGEIELVSTGHSTIHGGMFQPGVSPSAAYDDLPRPRFLLPARRNGYTQEARIGGHKVFLRTGEYDDGTLGELFIDLAKEGATLRGILSCFAIAVSKGLQYGVPLEEFVDTFTFQTFEPRGMVEGHPNIKMANSIVDYVFRALGVEYLKRDELAQVPPDRSSELPEPPKGLALEAGLQLDLTDAAMEEDIDAQMRAAAFVDDDPASFSSPLQGEVATKSPERVSTSPARRGEAPSASVIAAPPAGNVQTASIQAVLADKMGDAPLCDTCGHITVRNGSCYRCLNCGDSKGCS